MEGKEDEEEIDTINIFINSETTGIVLTYIYHVERIVSSQTALTSHSATPDMTFCYQDKLL